MTSADLIAIVITLTILIAVGYTYSIGFTVILRRTKVSLEPVLAASVL